MMFKLLCHLICVVFLTGGAARLEIENDNALKCGSYQSCVAIAKLTTLVNEMNNKLDKLDDKLERQARDQKELKTYMNRTLASTATISTQLGRHSTDLQSHDGRLKTHDVSQRSEYELVQSIYGAELGPRDCTDIRKRGHTVSGIYRVYPGSDDKRIYTDVYCDFRSSEQSWLVFQRRKDGSVNFERLWKDYSNGFGDLTGEFWLGNEKLSLFTTNRKYKLRVELEDFTGEKRYAEYTKFSVKPATDNYRLTIGGYSGNSGDSLNHHNGMQFSTTDYDNDGTERNCARIYRGAWWYNYACHQSNLNGVYLNGSHVSYADGIEWSAWRGFRYSYKTSEMKITAI